VKLLILLVLFIAQSTELKELGHPVKPGIYVDGNWKYELHIKARGTKSEERFGKLSCEGKEIIGNHGDTIVTPFGKLAFIKTGVCDGWLNDVAYDAPIFNKDGSWNPGVALRYHLKPCVTCASKGTCRQMVYNCTGYFNLLTYRSGVRDCNQICRDTYFKYLSIIRHFYRDQMYLMGRKSTPDSLFVQLSILQRGKIANVETFYSTIRIPSLQDTLLNMIRQWKFEEINTKNDVSTYCLLLYLDN